MENHNSLVWLGVCSDSARIARALNELEEARKAEAFMLERMRLRGALDPNAAKVLDSDDECTS